MTAAMERLDPRVVSLWRLQGVVRVLTFWLPASLAGGAFLFMNVGAAAAASLVGLVVALTFTLSMVWPSLSWRAFGYEVREHDLVVTQGVLFRHTVCVPLSRIQHVDTRQGPLERAWGVSQLVVYTAAGLAADGSIPGLDEGTANALRDQLARRGGDDGV